MGRSEEPESLQCCIDQIEEGGEVLLVKGLLFRWVPLEKLQSEEREEGNGKGLVAGRVVGGSVLGLGRK